MILCTNKVSALVTLIHILSLTASSAKEEGSGTGTSITGWNRNNVITEQLNVARESGEVYRSFVYGTVGPTWGDPVCGGVIFKQDKRGATAPGMKVVTSEDPINWRYHEPQSCLMSAGMNPITGEEKQCGDDHMTGKRFKIFSSCCTEPIDLVFDIIGLPGQSEVYRVFTKYKNLTPKPTKIKSFKFELGTGIGANFEQSSDNDGLAFTDRYGRLFTHWRAYHENKDLGAVFPFGLFGDADAQNHDNEDVSPHHDRDGYFDPTARAKFNFNAVSEDVLEARDLTPNVADLYGGMMQYFISKKQAPYALFYHDENDPTAESPLVADWNGTSWQTFLLCGGPTLESLAPGIVMETEECRQDASKLPAVLSDATVENLVANPHISVGLVEDFAGVAINSHIKVHQNFANDNNAFTLRLTPTAASDEESARTPWLDSMPWEADLGIALLQFVGEQNDITFTVENLGPDEVANGEVFIQVINNDGSVGYRKTLAFSNLAPDDSIQKTAVLQITDEAMKVKAVVKGFGVEDTNTANNKFEHMLLP